MKKLFLIFSLTMICIFANAQVIEKSYSFSNPSFTEIRGHEQLQLAGCMQTALIGQPSLPYQSVSLLLPQGQEAQSIEVILSDFVEMEGAHQLFPYQPSRTTNDIEYRPLVKDEKIYNSKEVYPAGNHGVVTTQYRNGYGFAFSAFTPVQYIPSEGKVMVARKALVKVTLTAAKTDHSAMLWGSQTVKNNIKRLAQNPEMIESYQTRGREVTGYDMLIITGEDYVEPYTEYCNFYNNIGLRNRIVTTAEIYSTMTGSDNQEKIRNYIIQEYQNNGIMMVILGGDTNIVPFRGLYCYVTSGGGDQESSSIPGDLYYCGLDGTWNDDQDNRWGEPGEDDLLPEVGISRMSFMNITGFNNMVHKSISYQQSPIMGEFRNYILAGEHLYDNPESNGSDYLELIIGHHEDNGYTTDGVPEDYNFVRLYEEEGTWSGSALRTAINSGVGYVHHNGHANSNYVAGWWGVSNSDFSGANGTTHNYTIFHSQGCDCGAFDENCILEDMITMENFAVAVIGNSRYGWFNEGQTEGPGTHLEREMVDAQFHDRIGYLGDALTESKCATAPWVTAPGQWEEGALRWNFYDIHVLGDGAVNLWIDEPMTANVDYPNEVVVGSNAFNVNVTDEQGNGLLNFRCLVYMDDEVIAMGVTDEEGVAVLSFENGLQEIGEMTLKVTGIGSYPQQFPMMAIPNNTPYVVYDSYTLSNGATQIDFNGSYTFDLVMKNIGSINANNVTATMSCESEYVTITQPTITIGDVNSNQSINLEDVFPFTVSDDVPNNTPVRFTITCTDGNDTWVSYFNTRIYAPEFEMIDSWLETSSGTTVMPGDQGILHFVFKNVGGATAPDGIIEVYNSHPEISLDNTHWDFTEFVPGSVNTIDINFSLSDAAEIGVLYELPYAIYHGNYLLEGSFFLNVGQVVEGFESGNFESFDWHYSSVVTSWEVVRDNPHEGAYCARSASIGDYESSVLYIDLQVNVAGPVSFYYKVSSEYNYDKLIFSIDDQDKGTWSGDIPWTQASFDLTPGNHTLKWEYRKDVSMSSGSDCAWIDDVVLPPVQIITKVEETVSAAPALYPNPNNGSFSLELPDEPCQVSVINSLGQLMFRQEGVSGLTRFELPALSQGMYFIQVTSANGHEVIKFVKE